MFYIEPCRKSNTELHENATYVGFEVGFCEEEGTVYSSIFNEILFGCCDELVIFHSQLNKNFLFPNKESAERYLKVHREMALQGRDVEQGVEMTIYEIWKFA